MELPVHSRPLSEIRHKSDTELDIIVLEFRVFFRIQQCLMYYVYDTNYHHFRDLDTLGKKGQHNTNNHSLVCISGPCFTGRRSCRQAVTDNPWHKRFLWEWTCFTGGSLGFHPLAGPWQAIPRYWTLLPLRFSFSTGSPCSSSLFLK